MRRETLWGSAANRVTTAVDVVDRSLLQGAGVWGPTLQQGHGPLVPDLGIGVVAPYLDLDNLALADDEWDTDGEVEREPGLHGGSMLFWLDAVEDILVELSREITSKAVQLSLVLLHGEGHAPILTEGLGFTLW